MTSYFGLRIKTKMTNEKIKPITADIHFQYSCPHCSNTFWLSLAESKTEGYISVCDMCQKPSYPATVKGLKIIYEDTPKPEPEKAEQKKEMSAEVREKCVQILCGYGYTQKESFDLVDSVQIESNNPVEIIRECLSKGVIGDV